MLTFFADESIVNRGGAEDYDLSIYGGIVLDEATFDELSQFIYKIKDKYVLPQELEIKWRFESYWENMIKVRYLEKGITKKTHPALYMSFKPDHAQLKNQILEKIAASSAKIIIAIRPNKLLGASDEQKIEYSIGAVARKFEKLLQKTNDLGIILADELPKRINSKSVIDHQYILKLCCRGSGTIHFKHLISIVPTINSSISPIHQINDVLLGAVQYYILEFIRQLSDPTRNADQARGILSKIIGNFLKAQPGQFVINNGILMYPPKVTRKNTAAGIFLNKLEKQLEKDFNLI